MKKTENNTKMAEVLNRVRFVKTGFFKNRHREVSLSLDGVVFKFVECTKTDILDLGIQYAPESEVWVVHASDRMSEPMLRSLSGVDGISALTSSLGSYSVVFQLSPLHDTRWVIVHAAAALYSSRHTALGTLPLAGTEQVPEDGEEDFIPEED